MLGQNITAHLHRNGYVLLPSWRREQTTIAIGRSIGAVVDIQALLPQSGIHTVQTLKPRQEDGSLNNRYSGTYSLDEFPLHTDLAHWTRPPRYFLLRCQNGSSTVATKLLANSTLLSVMGASTLNRALVRPRRAAGDDPLCLLPLVFFAENLYGFRWDPLFLVSMNAASNRVAQIMSNHAWYQSKLVSLTLAERGDTLIVDNWRFLHGRSRVSPADIDRRLERIYLSEIHT